jgi:hypothetical protein
MSRPYRVPFDDRIAPPDENGCRLWIGARDSKGYGRVRVGGRLVNATRVVWERAHGPILEGLFVCHTCDNPPCCELSHLWLGTNAENLRDAAAKGRLERGPGHGSPLTEADVAAIRASTERHVVVARRYGITPQAIGRIRAGKRWCAMVAGR